MTDFRAPLNDYSFLMRDVFDLPALWSSMEAFKEVDAPLADAVLEEASKMVGGTIAPLRRIGDQNPAKHSGSDVTLPAEYVSAYQQFIEAGWMGLTSDPAYGGQGMPRTLSIMFEEMIWSADPAFMLIPTLNIGAIKMFTQHGSDTLKDIYLEKMISGEWVGTMCLTESHAGSDLGIMTTKAVENGDGSYAVSGTKIFITGGEHNLTDNIVHFVLAKLPGAAEGTKGISLFLVPKFLPDGDGKVGERNKLNCGSIEHKMGINASSTCVMNFDGAKGWMIGEPGKGLKCMFAMMNDERLAMGLQGLGAMAAGLRSAADYANDRVQGRAPTGAKNPEGRADPIIVHPEVRRMLMDLKMNSEASRALAIYASIWLDKAKFGDDADTRKHAQGLADLLTPLCKAYMSDIGFEGTVTAQQVFGGHGYVQEWGMEQWVRDTRIAQIYEGANGIISMDLLGRKTVGSGGALVKDLAADIQSSIDEAADSELAAMVQTAVDIVLETTDWAVENAASDPDLISAAAVRYQRMLGDLCFGFMWLKMATAASKGTEQGEMFDKTKQICAHTYMNRTVAGLCEHARVIRLSAKGLMDVDAEMFG